MRTRHTALAVAAGLLAIAACNNSDFLTEVPYSFVGPSNFYRNAGDALAAINSVYADFIHDTGDNYYGRDFVMLVEYPTETVTTYLSAGNERSQTDNYTIPTSHSYVLGVWTSAYNMINRANAVIAHVPGIPMDTALRSRIVGEAKFLRALNYFNLVRLYGGVPLRLTETQGLDSLAMPRATAAQVYDQIIKDLQDAIAVLPSARTYTGADIGRASRGAAQTLLAKVYLQRAGTGVGTAADWQSSLDLSRAVEQSGDYSLVPDYSSLFDFVDGTVNENNSEVIFDIQNIRAPGLGGRISSHMAPKNSAFGASQNGSFEAESTFFDSYPAGDKRKAATWLMSFPTKKGGTATFIPWKTTKKDAYGEDSPAPKKFLDPLAGPTGDEEPNYIILRYAEVLLMDAEASNEVNGGPTAAGYAAINQVRARAGVAPLTPGLNQAQFRDSVFQERRWELVLEGPNGYFDDQRNWAWSKSKILPGLAKQQTKSNRYPKVTNYVGIPDKYKLMPIPQRAIDLNPLLTQNPGW